MAERHIIYVNGGEVEVTEAVYRAYKRSVWNENKRARYRCDVERSLEKYLELGMDFASETLVEEIVTEQILLEALLDALKTLSDEERALINLLFYEEMTEREAAGIFNISSVAVHRRKTRILEKLKKILR